MKKGFTLLELLIVVIIIGVLAVIAVPQYMNAAKRAQENKAKFNLQEIRKVQLAAQSVSGDWIAMSKANLVNLSVDLDPSVAGDDVRLGFQDASYTYELVVDSVRACSDSTTDYQVNLVNGALTNITCP